MAWVEAPSPRNPQESRRARFLLWRVITQRLCSLEIAEDLCRRRKPEKAVPYLEKALEDGNNLDACIQCAFLMDLPSALECLEFAELKGVQTHSMPLAARGVLMQMNLLRPAITYERTRAEVFRRGWQTWRLRRPLLDAPRDAPVHARTPSAGEAVL